MVFSIPSLSILQLFHLVNFYSHFTPSHHTYQEVFEQKPKKTIITLGLLGFDVSAGGWTCTRRTILTLDGFHT